MNRTSAACLQQGRALATERLTCFRLFWLFVLAGFLGDWIEVVFWLLTRGELTSRSSLVYGPFSLVWGLGAVVLTLALHPIAGRSAPVLFAAGAVLGGGYEYLCSWFQERVFGVYFWDYSHLPFNLNGRINLIFCLFWGLAAVAWVRVACPLLCLLIDRIPRRLARQLTIVLLAFLIFSTTVSAAALVRMEQRRAGVPASNPIALCLDERFPDQRLYDRYPSMGLPRSD